MAQIDLYMNDISFFDLNEFLLKIKVLNEFMDKSESLNQVEVEFLTNNFKHLIGIVPTRVHPIDSFTQPFERLVINPFNTRLKSVSQLRYPPKEIAHKIDYNRASLKGKCVMYAGTMGMLPITVEVKPKEGQLITRSKWQFNGKRKLKTIVICQDKELAILNFEVLYNDYKEYVKCLSAMQPNNRAVVEAVNAFIIKAFTRSVNPENRQGYIMSALISEYFYTLAEDPVDAIYYPSVANKGSSMNIAIKPEVVDELFDLIEVNEDIVTIDPSNLSGGWFVFNTGTCNNFNNESLKLNWTNMPIPEDSGIHELIEKYNINLKK